MGRIKNDFDALEELEALGGFSVEQNENRQSENDRIVLEEKIKNLSSMFITASSVIKTKKEKKPSVVTPQKGKFSVDSTYIIVTSSSVVFNMDDFGELDFDGISLLEESVAIQQSPSFSDAEFDLFSPLKIESPFSKSNKSKPSEPLDDSRPTKKYG